MFKDKRAFTTAHSFAHPAGRRNGEQSKTCKLVTNCFRIVSTSSGSFIHHYRYEIAPPPRDSAEEKWVLQQLWPELTRCLTTFVLRCPGHIFSPVLHDAPLALSVPARSEGSHEAHSVSIALRSSYPAEQYWSGGVAGEAEVVAQHIAHKLVEPLMHRRVGRRYFNTNDAVDPKAQLAVFCGFYAALNPVGCPAGGIRPQLQLDVMNRAVHKRTLLESLGLEDPVALDDEEVRFEWKRHCQGATVITTYNHRVYRVKAVHFDKTPDSQFLQYSREEQTRTMTTFSKFYSTYYSMPISEPRQPLLEAFPEKASEQVFLVPELCSLAGFSDEMRKDKGILNDALNQTKVFPQHRLPAIQEVAHQMAKATEEMMDAGSGSHSSSVQCLREWKVALDSNPVEVEGRHFEPVTVSFGPNRCFEIEDGSFQRHMRKGLQCPADFGEWLFIYPEADLPVLDVWLRSLRDIAQGAFGMKMGDPAKVQCSDQLGQLPRALEDNIKPTTQMVLLLTPNKDSRRVYQLFKRITCVRKPCITQVVKSETVRKRQSIAQILSRIVLQINAKFCGPLWHVDLACPLVAPLFEAPTMAVGVDVYRACSGERFLGFAASLDSRCSEYYSAASRLDPEEGAPVCPRSLARSLTEKLQAFLREALLHFARRSDTLLPAHVVVYRASVGQEDWALVRDAEVEAVLAVLGTEPCAGPVLRAGPSGEPYRPDLTFVAISPRAGARFFSRSAGGAKNPEPGTVVDSAAICRSDIPNFYLIHQPVLKGTASPTHYTVLYDSAHLPLNAIQNLSYRLSFLYFNFVGAVKMPAPAQYAKKIAQLVGMAVHEDPHPRLSCTFFYL